MGKSAALHTPGVGAGVAVAVGARVAVAMGARVLVAVGVSAADPEPPQEVSIRRRVSNNPMMNIGGHRFMRKNLLRR